MIALTSSIIDAIDRGHSIVSKCNTTQSNFQLQISRQNFFLPFPQLNRMNVGETSSNIIFSLKSPFKKKQHEQYVEC